MIYLSENIANIIDESITRLYGMGLLGIEKAPVASYTCVARNPTRNRPFGRRAFPTFAESKESERG